MPFLKSTFFRVSPVKSVMALLMAAVASLQVGAILSSGGNVYSRTHESTEAGLMASGDKPMEAANPKFAFKLYSQLLKSDANKNVFVSPSSIILALAMTYNGAGGKTREGMARTLEIEGLALNDVNTALADFQRNLGKADPKVQIKIANSLWARQGFTLKPDFIERSKAYYAAEVTSLDFNNPAAAKRINSWVKEKTENHIESIVDEIGSEYVLFLINAIYFKGQWKTEFDKASTKEDDFHLSTGQQKKVQMMSQSGQYRYLKGDDFQAVTLPYGNGRVNMYVFLPDTATTLEKFQTKLTNENWDNWIKNLRFEPGNVLLPRFKVEYGTELNDVLKALGMSEAFDPGQADLSGLAPISAAARLYISEVKHKAFAEVNEEGTKAAAVTSVGVAITSVQIPREPFTMKVDRPFFFAIRDDATGAILFMGSIVDPN